MSPGSKIACNKIFYAHFKKYMVESKWHKNYVYRDTHVSADYSA
jgi:uncharacterized protein YfeS